MKFDCCTLLGRYEGSHTTFLHFAVSPSDVTPMAFPLASNSTCSVEINSEEHDKETCKYIREKKKKKDIRTWQNELI